MKKDELLELIARIDHWHDDFWDTSKPDRGVLKKAHDLLAHIRERLKLASSD